MISITLFSGTAVFVPLWKLHTGWCKTVVLLLVTYFLVSCQSQAEGVKGSEYTVQLCMPSNSVQVPYIQGLNCNSCQGNMVVKKTNAWEISVPNPHLPPICANHILYPKPLDGHEGSSVRMGPLGKGLFPCKLKVDKLTCTTHILLT